MSSSRAHFPNLTDYEDHSPRDGSYNCIAFALGKTDEWWSWTTDGTWLDECNHQGRWLANLQCMFDVHGYEVCDTDVHEAGYEKVALYGNLVGFWTHAARQLPDGRWISKMGPDEDIIHKSPNDLVPGPFGTVQCLMKRRLPESGNQATLSPFRWLRSLWTRLVGKP